MARRQKGFMGWDEFAARSCDLWGQNWEAMLPGLIRMNRRTINRWRMNDKITHGPVRAMLEAFEQLKRHGMAVPGVSEDVIRS